MERLSDYLGIEVYSSGKNIGVISDFFIAPKEKVISGFMGKTNFLFGKNFFVSRQGILHIDRNGCVVDGKKVFYNRLYAEEYGEISLTSNSNEIGEIYFDASNMQPKSLSIKKSFFEDVVFGREIVDIDQIIISKNGLIKRR